MENDVVIGFGHRVRKIGGTTSVWDSGAMTKQPLFHHHLDRCLRWRVVESTSSKKQSLERRYRNEQKSCIYVFVLLEIIAMLNDTVLIRPDPVLCCMTLNSTKDTVLASPNFSTTLRELDMQQNKMSGSIPPGLGNLINLEYLSARDNRLSGGNNLSGVIPSSLAECRNLAIDLSANQFTGVLPIEIGNWKNLQYFDISQNMMFGKIPATLGNCVTLEFLSMARNSFEGSIPSSLETLRVPTLGVFKNTSATSIKGNNELCGGMPEFQLPKCEYKKSKKRPKLTLSLKLRSLHFLASWNSFDCVISTGLFTKEKKENASSNLGNFLLNVSYQSLLKATDGFSSTNLIGEGSFGSVYKEFFMITDRDFKALVYEFMVNGNLDEWLHSTPRTNEAPEENRNLSFIQRMNIAIDVANALEYLHHDCETTIVHCDLKPSNILLDDEMTARVVTLAWQGSFLSKPKIFLLINRAP
ncbi:hypothetical protein CJ030_MR4G010913 [Morella rubra]|uniref:Protein kinase domain-containing protein n=1 Tax=Morella rubra TaxID=262757 RepID=A0A6A1VSL7_9ROSI|nr:hypothetical protein CJ030_MR4G010913 [Morella rubra]